ALPDGVPMSDAAPTSRTPRPPLRSSSAHNAWREFQARAFKVVALGATLFGLVMLVVFFAGLGRDVVTWFRVMPGKIEEHNAQLVAHAEAAAKTMEADAVRNIDAQMAEDLAAAPDDQERETIRRRYESAKRRKLEDVARTRDEVIRSAER